MMNEEFVVDVLHHILNQISENILGDCCEIIEKLVESNHCTETPSINKTLCSVKLLLNLYEKILLNNAEIESTLPAGKIFQAIKYLSNKIFFDKSAQNDLLLIISVLCKIRVTCGIPKLSELLSNFYNDIFSEILVISKQKHYNSEQVIFLLKILCTLYSSQFCEKNITAYLKHENNVIDESLLFALLILHGDENIAMQTSLFLVPEFVKFFKTTAPLRHIWTEFTKWKCRNYSRIFLILCNFVSINFLIDEMNLVEFLIGQANYWELIQYGVLQGDVMMRKQAMFLFKKTIDVLSKKRGIDEDIIEFMDLLPGSTGCTLEGNFNCHWDPNRKNELIKIYSDIIIILEYLNEEQVHIVRPIFDLIEKVIEKTIQGHLIHFSWIFLIYEIVLMHESTEVIKWGIKSLLKVPLKVLLDETAVRKMAILISSNLNNINLYYNNGLDITETLGAFFENIAQVKTAELFFKAFIKEVCKLVWNPESLFFVTRSFSRLRELSFWGLEEITDIRMFVSKAFKTHNKTIRNGIQCEILNAVLALTHGRSLPLDSMLLLFSKFSTSEIFRAGYQTWNNVIMYLKYFYSEEDAERILILFLNSPQLPEECTALSITLFHRAFEDDFASKTFLELLSSFKNSHQRPYCDVSILNRYLSIVCQVIEECIQCSEHPKLVALVFQFFEDVALHIRLQIRVISSLKDFTTGQLYLKTFESLVKLLSLTKHEYNFEDLFVRLLKSLESDLCCERELPPVQTYFGIRLVRVIYESSLYKLEPGCLGGHILQHMNKTLRKEENNKNVQMIWGKMNSEFFEAKWVILENLIRNGKIRATFDKTAEMNCIHNEDLLRMCTEGLDIGGYGVLRPVMHILSLIIPQMNDIVQLESVVDSVWRMTLERRKTDDFKFCVESFVNMLFHKKMFSKREDILQILFKYIDLIFSDSSLVMVHELMKHIENLELSDKSKPVLCRILGKGILFGPVQKKDEKLTSQVCSYVQLFRNCPESEHITSCKIRALAVVKLLTIRNVKGVSKSVIDTLRQAESEISKRRTRYFGNSYIHLIKTRLMQGMLVLLEPSEKEEKKKIAQWIYLSLMMENPQTSVRHLQEWSLSLLYKFCYSSFNFYRDAVKKTPKGWCSLMTITYLLAKAALYDIDEAIQEILPFCMDQHFEARLYAEVVIVKLYYLAQQLGLRKVVEKWKVVHDSIKLSIERAKGNAAKNYDKLEKHFFFNGFNIDTHYSLQTIYYDLPRLTNVTSNEWISSEVFEKVSISGVHDLGLTLFSRDQVLQRLNNTEWLIGKSEETQTDDEQTEEASLENYQKKMIPMKPLIPGCGRHGESAYEYLEKEGLIVVASLIDLIPNLGGLARTCEVFGASQLVLNTAKCIEDKEFKSVSVTAEKWIQVKEVKAESLLEYVIEMKQKGFLIMGAEQAVHSEPLTKTKFPRRCLLILGNEKRGIPPNLIPFLDICVEIPQTGIIRSLNVHVTGALFLWEYAKQNLFAMDED